MSESKAALLGWRGGGSNARRNVTMIETTVARDATRRAKIAFWAVGSVVAVSTAVIGAGITSVALAIVIGIVAGFLVGFSTGLVIFCWPALRVAWHWAAEIIALLTFLSAYVALIQVMPWWAALTVLSAVVGGPLLVPAIRRTVLPWVWCAISRHRLRLCFAAFIASQRWGATPLVLWARPIPAGERIWVWLRPGLALPDLEARTDRLAAGCWAAECRIAPASSRYSALVRIDIARRNPLGGLVGSPLTELVPRVGTRQTITSTMPSGLDLPDVPDTPPAVSASASEPKRRLKAVAATPAAPDPVPADVVPTNRDDLSDWI